jgi:hypothetical protein
MSATLPPAADLDRPSDFGEFYRYAEAAPRPPSVMPEPEAEEVASIPLTPEHQARRARFRRAVRGIVLGLLAFTALATCVHVVRRAAARSDEAESAQPVSAAPRVAERAQPVAAPPVAQLSDSVAPSAIDEALALARTPVATLANLQSWTKLAGQLSPEDRKRVEHDLSRSSVTGTRATQEAARLQLALLWRATARRAKAQKVLVSLARTATDPVVKKYALGALTTA